MNVVFKRITATIMALSMIAIFELSATAGSNESTQSMGVVQSLVTPVAKSSSSASTEATASVVTAAPTTASSSADTGTTSSTKSSDKSSDKSSTTTSTKAAEDSKQDETAKANADGETAEENPTLEVPDITAGAAVVMDCDTGTILYGLNENTQMPMASTTKIMTCLLVLEAGDIGRIVTVTEDYYQPALDGSTLIGLKVGDKITLYDLCVAMIMYSGNDAANVAAVEVGGSIEGFVSMMNEKACELGMLNTHFDTPSGLDQDSDGAHYSTAYDMALLGAYAMKNPDFADIAKFKARDIYYDAFPRGRTLTTHNHLLAGQAYGYKGCDGIKTGVTDLAGQCLVSHVTTDEGLSLVCVSLNNSNRWNDHRKLYDYARSLYTTSKVNPDVSDYDAIVVGGSKKTVSVECTPDATFNVLKTQVPNLTKQIVYDKFIYAPIEKGDVVGYLQYKSDGTVVASYPITASESISATTGGWFSEYMQAIEYSSGRANW